MPLSVVRRNVQAGYTDAHGFHPLRGSADYDPDRAGDDYGARTDAGGLRYGRGKLRVVKKRKASGKRKATGTKRKAKRNGRSFVRKGESVPSWYQPKAGEVWYLSGVRGVIKRVGDSDGTPYVWFARPVDGTLAMSIRNLVQAGRLQRPTAKNPPDRDRPRFFADNSNNTTRATWLQRAWDAGKRWYTSGDYYTSGVANARVVKYGFSKWLPFDNVRNMGVTKAELLKTFRDGYNTGKRTSKKNGLRPRKGKLSPRVGAALTKYVRGQRNPGGGPPPASSSAWGHGSRGEYTATTPYGTYSILPVSTSRTKSGTVYQINYKAAAGGRNAYDESRTLQAAIKKARAHYKRLIKGQPSMMNPGKAKRKARATQDQRWRDMGIRRLKGAHSGARRMEQIYQSRARGSRDKSPYAKGLKILDAGARNPKSKQKWVWPYRRFKKNLERITYTAGIIQPNNSFISKSNYVIYKRAEAMRYIKEHASKANPGKHKRAERARFKGALRRQGVKSTKGPRGYARHEYKTTSSIRRGSAMKAPGNRKYVSDEYLAAHGLKRKSNPLATPGTKIYEVKIPRTFYDTGYTLTIRAKSVRTARAEAKSYCAASFAKKTGLPKSRYRLPSATKVKVIG